GTLMAVQDEATINIAHERTKRLNNYLMTKARGSNDLNYLASPVTGGGIGVSRFQQLFLLALQNNHKQPHEQARFVWDLLAMQGQRLIKDGKTLETVDANIAELKIQASEFMTKRLAILKALKIA
ncbi:MAG: methyltransferase, partial [Advenella sp.]